MENFCQLGRLEKHTIKNLLPVLHDAKTSLGDKNSGDKIVYEVCRGVRQNPGLCYDITRIYPGKIGQEIPKTFGHCHAKGMAEIFETLSGQSLMVLQKNKTEGVVEEAYVVEINEGERAIVPPGFYFNNSNPRKNQELLIANWVGAKTENKYEDIAKLKGLCYYIIEDEKGSLVFIKNKNYKKVAELVKVRPKPLPQKLENLDFLLHPSKYADFLTIDSLYRKI